MSIFPRREVDVEGKVYEILKMFVNQRFNNIIVADVIRQYDRGLEGREVDIAVIRDDGLPLLLIETKKKYDKPGSFRAVKRFMVTSEDVLGQLFSYAAILKKNNVHVPFVIAINDSQIAVFMVPEDINEHVDWDAIKERDYDRVLSPKYLYETIRQQYLLVHKRVKFAEDFFAEILDLVTGIYARKYGVEEKRQELHWVLIEDLRGFVDFLTPYIQDAIAPNDRFRDNIARRVEEYARVRGYTPTPDQLAREMAYVLLNKIIFYKVLEKHYKIEELKPLYREGVVRTVSEYLGKLRELFSNAIRITEDFEPIFITGLYDNIDITENEEVLRALDWLVNLIDVYRIEKLGDIIGYIYEDLIPGEERHQLGQFYTPKPIAELIVKWAVRTPDDKVLDPGCGSGTFLIEAYKMLAELKMKKLFSEIKYVRMDVHNQILGQLYGIDINEFPAHLTAMNLAMRNPRNPSTNINIIIEDYFNITPGLARLAPYTVRDARGERKAEIVFENFDVIIGNPPYTRWNEIPEETRRRIEQHYSSVLREYRILRHVTGGALPGIYVPWIIHATGFLKKGGRLGMIISDSWLQTDYGRGFLEFLLNNYKINAIIDLGFRVFGIPLIGACIILAERTSKVEDGEVRFIYVGRDSTINELLGTIRGEKVNGFFISNISISRIREELKKRSVKPLAIFMSSILEPLTKTALLRKLEDLFDVSEGNTVWSIYASRIGRGAGVGGEEFYYLDDDDLDNHDLRKYIRQYIHPFISTPDHLPNFTFTANDWERINGDRYILIANAPRENLPNEVRKYIELGEKTITLTKGSRRGQPVNMSVVARERARLNQWTYRNRTYRFHDWYDLGGVIEAPIYVARGAQYWVRFVLSRFNCALDDRILALIPKENINFTEDELKALLTFLNSSFSQIQAEMKGRTTGGGMLELDVRPLSEFLILDIKKLPSDVVRRLAELFDRLESESRRLGGANTVENIFGSEFAKELTGRDDVRLGIVGLWNTVIKDVDYEIARILGLESLVEPMRNLLLELVRRRLSRAKEARPEALRGTEEQQALRGRRVKRRQNSGPVRGLRLDAFFLN